MHHASDSRTSENAFAPRVSRGAGVRSRLADLVGPRTEWCGLSTASRQRMRSARTRAFIVHNCAGKSTTLKMLPASSSRFGTATVDGLVPLARSLRPRFRVGTVVLPASQLWYQLTSRLAQRSICSPSVTSCPAATRRHAARRARRVPSSRATSRRPVDTWRSRTHSVRGGASLLHARRVRVPSSNRVSTIGLDVTAKARIAFATLLSSIETRRNDACC